MNTIKETLEISRGDAETRSGALGQTRPTTSAFSIPLALRASAPPRDPLFLPAHMRSMLIEELLALAGPRTLETRRELEALSDAALAARWDLLMNEPALSDNP